MVRIARYSVNMKRGTAETAPIGPESFVVMLVGVQKALFIPIVMSNALNAVYELWAATCASTSSSASTK